MFLVVVPSLAPEDFGEGKIKGLGTEFRGSNGMTVVVGELIGECEMIRQSTESVAGDGGGAAAARLKNAEGFVSQTLDLGNTQNSCHFLPKLMIHARSLDSMGEGAGMLGAPKMGTHLMPCHFGFPEG